MLTIADIDAAFRKGKAHGENILHFAGGVGAELTGRVGPPGDEAGKRFSRAAFHFRDGEIGRKMVRDTMEVEGALGDHAQFVELSGGVLAATSLVAAIDLTAAAFRRLHVQAPMLEDDPGREADLTNFPNLETLPKRPRPGCG